jgi:hypothetical protein
VTHACNPSYSGSRVQENHGWKPASENRLKDPMSKKTQCKKGLMQRLKVQAMNPNPSTKKIKKSKKRNDISY